MALRKELRIGSGQHEHVCGLLKKWCDVAKGSVTAEDCQETAALTAEDCTETSLEKRKTKAVRRIHLCKEVRACLCLRLFIHCLNHSLTYDHTHTRSCVCVHVHTHHTHTPEHSQMGVN